MENDTNYELSLASYYLDVGRPESALDALDGLDEIVLDDPDYWHIRGSALYEIKLYADAVKAFSNGLNLEPEYIESLYMLSTTYQMLGNLAGAERAILQALGISPETPALLSKYAELVAAAGQFDKSDQLLEEASRIDPEDESLLRARYVVAVLKGNDRETRQYGEQLIAQNPEDPNILLATGMNLIEQGNVRQGYNRLRGAASSDPDIVREFRSVFDESRVRNHWLLMPLWPIDRIGMVTMWISAMVIIFGLRLLGFHTISGFLGLVWFIYAIYSWTAPPLVRWYIGRKYR